MSVSTGFAEDPPINIYIDPETIGMNEQATITIEVSQKPSGINAPKSPNYDLTYTGESSSSQVSIINGRMTSKTTFSYSFIFAPKLKGMIDIGSFEVLIQKKSYRTPEKKIKVIQENTKKQTKNNFNPFADMDEFFGRRPKIPSLYLKLVPHQAVVYQNQQVILDAYIIVSDQEAFNYQYSEAAPIRSDKSALYDIPQFPDAGITKNGEFYRKLVKRYVIYPIETGKIGIVPPSIIAITPYGQIQLKSENIGIDSVKINNNSGISYIGDLAIKAIFSTNQVEKGKNFEVRLEMTGNGNLKVLSNPYINLKIDGIFLSYPVTDIKFLEYKNGQAYFRQNIKYSFLPQKSGFFYIPPVIINYYSSELVLKEIKLDGFNIVVNEKKGTEKKTDLKLKIIDNPVTYKYILFNPFFLITIFIFIIFPLISYLYGRHKDKMNKDRNYSRKFLANKRFFKYLSEARTNLDGGNIKDFYTSLQKGMFYYITDKLNIPGGIGIKELVPILREKKLSEDTIKNFEEIYQDCTKNAYSSVSGNKIPDSAPAYDMLDRVKILLESIK